MSKWTWDRKLAMGAIVGILLFFACSIFGCTVEQRRDFADGFQREMIRQAVDGVSERLEKKLDVELDDVKDRLADAGDNSDAGMWSGLGTLAAILTIGAGKAGVDKMRGKT